MNLHDWIDELCDALDVEAEVDEALVLDLAAATPHTTWSRPAAPMTAYLLGFAAGTRDADPETVEALAARAQALAEGWDRRPTRPTRRTWTTSRSPTTPGRPQPPTRTSSDPSP